MIGHRDRCPGLLRRFVRQRQVLLAQQRHRLLAGPERGGPDLLRTAAAEGLDKVTTTQTVVGTRMNWVDANLDRHTRQGETRATEEKNVGGVDPASALTEMQQIMTILEASQASFVKLANMSLFDMIR